MKILIFFLFREEIREMLSRGGNIGNIGVGGGPDTRETSQIASRKF
jgi:hypothetical protein